MYIHFDGKNAFLTLDDGKRVVINTDRLFQTNRVSVRRTLNGRWQFLNNMNSKWIYYRYTPINNIENTACDLIEEAYKKYINSLMLE